MIKTLRETARTQLLHAIERWPSSCSTHLWSFALRYAAQVHNEVPKKGYDLPINKFSGVQVQTNLNHLHAFGCPVYALNSNLASGKTIGNWNRRARLGIYLGPSPRHARSVSLIMNPSNGLVSPQFHISHNEFFDTINRTSREPTAPWKSLAGILSNKSTAIEETRAEQEWMVRPREVGLELPSYDIDNNIAREPVIQEEEREATRPEGAGTTA